jgi:hypothetical protein
MLIKLIFAGWTIALDTSTQVTFSLIASQLVLFLEMENFQWRETRQLEEEKSLMMLFIWDAKWMVNSTSTQKVKELLKSEFIGSLKTIHPSNWK